MQIVNYPKGGGELRDHVDPRKNQRVVSGLIMSKIGEDFKTGGFYFRDKKNYFVYDHSSSKKTNINLYDYLKIINKIGCGEVVISSIDNDGYLNGYDLGPLKKIRKIVDFPIITNGGCGNPKHMEKAFKIGSDACGAGSIFYYTKFSYKDIKNHLKKNKIKVR